MRFLAQHVGYIAGLSLYFIIKNMPLRKKALKEHSHEKRWGSSGNHCMHGQACASLNKFKVHKLPSLGLNLYAILHWYNKTGIEYASHVFFSLAPLDIKQG
jgi:hypothetical protein